MMAPVYRRVVAAAIQNYVGRGDGARVTAQPGWRPDCPSRSGRAGGGLWPEEARDAARGAQSGGQEGQQRLGLEE